jgi:hypothetical protein
LNIHYLRFILEAAFILPLLIGFTLKVLDADARIFLFRGFLSPGRYAGMYVTEFLTHTVVHRLPALTTKCWLLVYTRIHDGCSCCAWSIIDLLSASLLYVLLLDSAGCCLLLIKHRKLRLMLHVTWPRINTAIVCNAEATNATQLFNADMQALTADNRLLTY